MLEQALVWGSHGELSSELGEDPQAECHLHRLSLPVRPASMEPLQKHALPDSLGRLPFLAGPGKTRARGWSPLASIIKVPMQGSRAHGKNYWSVCLSLSSGPSQERHCVSQKLLS